MKDFIVNSAYFGVAISLLGYEIGLWIKRKLKFSFINPLLISIILVIGALLALRVDYEAYLSGAKFLSWLLTPATVCLAVPLYEQLSLLKPYSFVLEDDDCETVEELFVVDDDIAIIDPVNIDTLDSDLDDFLENLLKS